MRGCRESRENREQRRSERNETACVRACIWGRARKKVMEVAKKRETAGRKSESGRGIRRSADEGLRWLCS